ncbi:MAG: hypothetical protein JNM34_05995 [Chthonomonadaceae bacterium]|nr:hypothetical protein [Chthonomonadaceae bacterium]
MNEKLFEKLIGEQPVTLEEALTLDQALEAQVEVRRAVSSLRESEPSLAWRSELNQRLLVGHKAARKSLVLRWIGGASLVTACCAMFLVLSRPTVKDDISNQHYVLTNSEGPAVSDALFTAHREADMESGMGIMEPVADVKPGL